MDKSAYVKVSEDALNKMLEAVELDRQHQADTMRTLREDLRNTARPFVPEQMPEDFYRGMISALLTQHAMLPESSSMEHALISVEEMMRVVLDQIVEERARRTMEVA